MIKFRNRGEAGLGLDELKLFGIYFGPQYDKTSFKGDQVSLVQVSFICKWYNGE